MNCIRSEKNFLGLFAVFKLLTLFYLCRNLQYIEVEGTEHFHTLKGYPGHLEKKVTLLKYFLSYMNDHLLKVTIMSSL